MNTSELYQQAVAKLASESTMSAADERYLQAIEAKHGAAESRHATPAGDTRSAYLKAIERLNSTRPWAGGEEPEIMSRQQKDLIRSGGGVLYL